MLFRSLARSFAERSFAQAWPAYTFARYAPASGKVNFNFAATVSFGASATCLALAVLGVYLGQSSSSRHFRYVAAAGVAASFYCVTDALLAGRFRRAPFKPAVLRIEIADDGDGVPLEARLRLFTPFFTTRATGTGLGLALVRRIAGAHGGTVDYEPTLDGGASFVLRVPLRARDDTPKRLLGDDVR